MRALGLTCGIGSMLIGARAAGFEVVGNIEWRKYYHVRDDQGRNTFTENFPGAFMVHSIDELTEEQIEGLRGIDLVMGHPDCGAWSQLNSVQKNYKNRKKKSEDLPIFVEGIRRIQPRFFVMDNLPQCFQGLSIEEWVGSLPNYDLSIEWISNYHYGNIQLNRRRLFIVGSKKEEKYSFIPGECWHDTCVKDQLNDLPLQEDLPRINHCHVDPDDNSKWPTLDGDGAIFWTFRELAHYLMTLKEGANGYYRNKQGEIKKKVGRYRTYWNKHSHVITGGSIGVPSFVMWDVYHPLTGYPLTIRERARIQGCPDEFIFFGPEEFLVRQTGKFMPVQFCTYVARQIAAHIQGQPFETSGERLIKPNPHIDAAKKWYCENVGYGDNQERVCEVCWMKNCSIHPADEPRVFAPPEPAPIAEAEVPSEQVSKKKSRPQNQRASSVTDDEVVNLRRERDLPEDHVGVSKYAERYEGQLIRPDGSYYNRLVRNRYYDPVEKKHPAKTPLHIARWAIQEYTEPGDWILDPTIGAGTTAVESLRMGRNVCGIELEFVDVVLANIQKNDPEDLTWRIYKGDALNLEEYLAGDEIMSEVEFDLIVNNPPYSGDLHQGMMDRKSGVRGYAGKYCKDLPSAAHHRENKKYWDFIEKVYGQCINRLRPGGRFVIGVKDMMRNGEPFLLHEMLGNVLSRYLIYERMVLLKHHPTTLFLNTYEKKTGKKPPLYQTILVFRKEAPDDQG